MSNKTDELLRGFQPSKPTKHFKIDKQTKRLLALSKFPQEPKLNAQEQAKLKEDTGTVLEPLTKSGFKALFIKGDLSLNDARLSGLRDPLWKPKKKDAEAEEGEAAGAAATTNKSRKGKKAPKMRSAKQESATNVETNS